MSSKTNYFTIKKLKNKIVFIYFLYAEIEIRFDIVSIIILNKYVIKTLIIIKNISSKLYCYIYL
jgi:hypothetical protein